MPIYEYQHPKTGEVFEGLRSMKDADKVFKSPDGVVCKRNEIPSRLGYCRKGDQEVFEADPLHVRKCNPKFIKFRDGHKERYDPTKHR